MDDRIYRGMNASGAGPLVTVVLTTYNRREFLPRAIETVAEQTYDEIELVVVDDHSSESPQDIVENAPYDGLRDVIFVRHEENRGVSAARNTGIKRANGELIALLDDDDLWTPDKIERQVAEFRRSGNEVSVVCTGIRSVDAGGATIRTKNVGYDGNITKQLLCGAIVPLPSVLVRADLLDDAGLFDERLRLYEDQEWMIRLSRRGEFRSVGDPLVISQRDGHEQLTDDVETKVTESYPLFMEKCRPIAAEYGRLFERKMVAHWSFRAGYASLIHGESMQARQLIGGAILTWPFASEFYLYGLLAALGNEWYRRAQSIKRRIEHYRHERTAGT
jgi:glycosyltransferase involved in cell wall biosynthesis